MNQYKISDQYNKYHENSRSIAPIKKRRPDNPIDISFNLHPKNNPVLQHHILKHPLDISYLYHLLRQKIKNIEMHTFGTKFSMCRQHH